MPEGHDTIIEVSNIMSFVLYTQILKQSVLKPASPGITLKVIETIEMTDKYLGYKKSNRRGFSRMTKTRNIELSVFKTKFYQKRWTCVLDFFNAFPIVFVFKLLK